MKKDLRTSVPTLELRNGTYEGGFAALPAEQLLKVKGGTINSGCANSCTNNCTPPPANLCTANTACGVF